ncbi:MAG: HD-GYP domain-containing protein [bacterium]|nr:HD-GYP domain-containing protein [bacterium]
MITNTVCITLSQAQIGMVCAEDIYSSSRLKLIEKGEAITQTHLFRLKLYQIFHIHVYYDPAMFVSNQESQTNSGTEIVNAFECQAHFKRFKKNYIFTLGKINLLIYSLIEGTNVEQELYQCCSDLLSYLPNNNDLFSYLYHIESKTDKEATLMHCLNVAMICSIFGKWLNLPDNEVKDLTLSGLLHDIGKFNISNDIINKPGRLTAEEFEIIKNHPIDGFHRVKDSALSYGVKMAILQHHEKIDGSGYPYGFQSKEIHEYAKIVEIIDIYDAMTSDRTYRKRISPFCVLNILENDGHTMLDSKLLSIFLEQLAILYIGKTALLSNGETGKIILVNRNLPSRPLVQTGSKLYNLEFEKDLNIVDII